MSQEITCAGLFKEKTEKGIGIYAAKSFESVHGFNKRETIVTNTVKSSSTPCLLVYLDCATKFYIQ